MTNPRIDSQLPETISNAADLIRVIEASNQQPTPAIEEEATTSTFDDVVETFDRFREDAYVEYVQPYADVLGSAFDTPADDIRNLQSGQSRVIELKGGLDVYAAAGASAGVGGKVEVSREHDVYSATLEGDASLAAGLGLKAEIEGIAANAGTSRTVRVTIQGEGDAARDELAELVELSSPAEFARRVRASDHLNLRRAEVAGGLGAEVSAEYGVSAKAKVDARLWVGYDFADETAGDFSRQEFDIEIGAGTPTAEATNPDALARVLTRSTAATPLNDEISEILEANGGVAGVRVASKATLAIETRNNRTEGHVAELTMKVRGTVGGNEVEFAHRVTSTVSDREIDDLAGAAQAGPQSFIEAATALGLKVETSAQRVEFDGAELRGTPFVEGKNGIETRTPIWQLNGVR